MNQLLLVLVGAIGIGLGIGAALLVPKGDGAQTASAASSFEMFEGGAEEEGAEESGGDVPARELFEVVKVIDGDTVTLKMGEKNETVRLIGIDTPETNDVRTGVQCFGAEATSYMKKIIGKRVALEKDAGQGERDKYDRLLAYLFAENGMHLNKKMIEEGYAYEYTYDEAYKYQKEYKAVEAAAKEAERGLWAPDACPSAVQAGTKPTATVEAKKEVVVPVVAPVAPAVLGVSTTPMQEPPKQEAEARKEEPEPKPEPSPEPEPQKPASSGEYTCSSNAYNCSHFKTQAEAQSVFEMCGGTANDVHRLDGNKDGEVCESLP